METSTYDLLLVGVGVAGLRAAIAADIDPQHSVSIVSKINPMGRHMVSVDGSIRIVPQVCEQ